jgi:hypothetical protein
MKIPLTLIYTLFFSLIPLTSIKAQRLHKLIIYVDTYVKEDLNKEKINAIFLVTSAIEVDLSLQLYSKAIKSKLNQLNYQNSLSSKYHLTFEVSTSSPISQLSTSTESIHSTSVVTRENEKGEEEEFEVASSMSVPSYSQSLLYFHHLKLKLFDNEKGALIWQGEAVINNTEASQQKHAAVMVSAVLDYFLADTKEHPSRVKVKKKAQKRIRADLKSDL